MLILLERNLWNFLKIQKWKMRLKVSKNNDKRFKIRGSSYE